MINPLEMLGGHLKNFKSLTSGLRFTSFFLCFLRHPVWIYCTGKVMENGVPCPLTYAVIKILMEIFPHVHTWQVVHSYEQSAFCHALGT